MSRTRPCLQNSTSSFCGRLPLVRPAVRRNLSIYSLIGSPFLCFVEAREKEKTSTSQLEKRCRNFRSRSLQDLMLRGRRCLNHSLVILALLFIVSPLIMISKIIISCTHARFHINVNGPLVDYVNSDGLLAY